jgi:hypothetical protein
LHHQAQKILSRMTSSFDSRQSMNDCSNLKFDSSLIKGHPRLSSQNTMELLRIRPFTSSLKHPKSEYKSQRKRKIEIGLFEPQIEDFKEDTLKSLSQKGTPSAKIIRSKNASILAKVSKRVKTTQSTFRLSKYLRSSSAFDPQRKMKKNFDISRELGFSHTPAHVEVRKAWGLALHNSKTVNQAGKKFKE